MIWAIYIVILLVIILIAAVVSSSLLGLAIGFFIASLIAIIVVMALSWSCLDSRCRRSMGTYSLGVVAVIIFIVALILLIVAIVMNQRKKKKILLLKRAAPPPIHDAKVERPEKPVATLHTEKVHYKNKKKLEHHQDEDGLSTYDEKDVEKFQATATAAQLRMSVPATNGRRTRNVVNAVKSSKVPKF